mmetsp:Transcript_2768/g.5406  ORF Transcript_2768/g.5406 Transcript_2768/m.5406 type:complete len:757 (+) Transcript_2768:339-2609(+)
MMIRISRGPQAIAPRRIGSFFPSVWIAIVLIVISLPNNAANAFSGPVKPIRIRITSEDFSMRTPTEITSCQTKRLDSFSTERISFSKTQLKNSMRTLGYRFRRRLQMPLQKIRLLAFASVLLSALCPKMAFATSSKITTATLSSPTQPSYHLTRILFLRLLAVVYTSAFSVAKFQNKGLIGDRGITPAKRILDEAQKVGEARSARRKEWVKQRAKYDNGSGAKKKFHDLKNKLSDSKFAELFRDKFWYRQDRAGRPLPTLLWLARDRDNLNPWLDGLANVGLFLSTVMLASGSANVFLLLGLYVIQRTFMSVGGPWYGYGWEPQLAELTFHALFLVPLFSMDPFFGWIRSNTSSSVGPFPVPKLVIWAVRWYLFKIMIGAGLIKIKSSDPKWKPGNMSAMYYFYETQPVPNPFTKYFHFMPKWWHRFEVWSNHFVELVAPFLLLMPSRQLRQTGGLIQIMFQVILISSGNLSFLNWLTIVPAIFCLDDAFLMNNLPPIVRSLTFGTPSSQSYVQCISSGAVEMARQSHFLRTTVSTLFYLLMAKLNINVVRNLFAQRQLMNASFDKLRLCSTYGAFGVVSETRQELIIESANNIDGPWKEYHFRVKPGDIHKRPPWISPYHHRLDWQMWIAAQSGRIERNPWLYKFLLKLLQRGKDVIDLLEGDPWESSSSDATIHSHVDEREVSTKAGSLRTIPELTHGPKYIRIEKYRYKFFDNKNNAKLGDRDEPQYWIRERVGRYFPEQGVMTKEILEEFLR